MSQTDSQDKNEAKRFPWFPVTLFLLLAYPLSTGPVFWLRIHGYASGKTACLIMAIVYAPIDWLAESSEIFSNIYMWYLWLFWPHG